MKKSAWLLVNVLMVAALALAACGGGGTAAPAEQTEVTFWHAYGTGSAEETAMTAMVASAQAALPHLKINVLQVPFNDVFNKYRTDVAAGGGPDMFIAPNDSLGADARAGLIADITSLVEGKLTGYKQLAIDGMTLDGKIYGVPESLKAVAVFYNKDLLPTPPATTDELMTALQNGEKIAISFGCYHHWGFYNAFGGQIFDANYSFVADQGGVADAMAYLNEAYQIAVAEGLPKNDSDAAAPFREGQIAATFNGNWALGDYKTALGDKLGVAPMPSGPGGPASPLVGVDGFYLNPNSQKKEAAIELALYLTNAESQTKMMNDAGHVPARTDVQISDPLVQAFDDAFDTGTVRPQVEAMDKYWANFCGTDQVFEQGIAADEWVNTATATAKQ
jgi:arabinogalactan oligomer/maltooligosaccharide transport system substrate-binding protein